MARTIEDLREDILRAKTIAGLIKTHGVEVVCEGLGMELNETNKNIVYRYGSIKEDGVPYVRVPQLRYKRLSNYLTALTPPDNTIARQFIDPGRHFSIVEPSAINEDIEGLMLEIIDGVSEVRKAFESNDVGLIHQVTEEIASTAGAIKNAIHEEGEP